MISIPVERLPLCLVIYRAFPFEKSALERKEKEVEIKVFPLKNLLHLCIQGDTSGCSLGFVDMKTKGSFQYRVRQLVVT